VASKREKLCIHLDDDFGGWESPFEYFPPLGNLSYTQLRYIHTVIPEGGKKNRSYFLGASRKYIPGRKEGPIGKRAGKH
jgi:hypothetical protein